MDEEKAPDLPQPLAAAQTRLEKLHFERELRGLEFKAFSGVLEALRASGKPNSEKDTIIKSLRDYFRISDERHKSELRVLAYDEKLSLISEKLSGYKFTDEWAKPAQRIYVPLGPQNFSLPRPHLPNSTVVRLWDGKLKDGPKQEETSEEEEEDSDVELELVQNILNKQLNHSDCELEKTPITIAIPGGGNEEEMEEIAQQMKKKYKVQPAKQSPAKSPDIIEAPRTPTKSNSLQLSSKTKAGNINKGRGVKRKLRGVDDATKVSSPANSAKARVKKFPVKTKGLVKVKKPVNPPAKIKISRRPESKRVKESSEETSSADEGENGLLLPNLDESSRVMSPVFSEVIRSSILGKTRGRDLRGRTGGDRRRNHVVTSPSKSKTGKSRARNSNQKSKFKNICEETGSRRKSKLNEKLDYDDVLMDLEAIDMKKKHLPTYRSSEERKLAEEQELETRVMMRDYKSTDEYSTYSDYAINFNEEDMEQVTDGVFKRPLPPSRGPKPWEIQDARLTLEVAGDENNSRGNVNIYGERIMGSPSADHSPPYYTSMNEPHSPSKYIDQPPHKKQRIKSPLVVNPNINPPNVGKVPLSAPIFSTSLSASSKKRQKPVSVVDSLNLHLPTSATASSLAASSSNRRPGTTPGGGCSMFSNSSALIAGARGTAPGILQQQRKAQPHILSNSKVHQRTFLPITNSSITNNVVSNSILPISGTPVSLPCGTSTITATPVAGAPAVQISNSSIPLSAQAVSTVPPTAMPFQSFSNTNSPGLNINTTGVPIGHVNRSTGSANIIFVQKANGPSVSSPTAVPNTVIPLKTPPRAVILRRTQIPRQGNVMIIDMQKNQLVGAGQVPPFIQTARILNAPGELSLVNLHPNQSNTAPIKSIPSTIVTATFSSSSPMQPLQSPTFIQRAENEVLQATNQEAFISTRDATEVVHTPSVVHEDSSTVANEGHLNDKALPSIVESSDSPQSEEVPHDAQYAQIEQELMQMEEGNFEEVVYEEEVITETVPLDDTAHQYLYSTDNCSNSTGDGLLTPQDHTHNASSASGSSTDTASENETSLNHFESPEHDSNRHAVVKKVSLSPTGQAKIASEAISRALSLSKSSSTAKKLTFAGPLITSTPAYTACKTSTSSLVKGSIVRTHEGNLPIIFQATTTSLKPSGIIVDGDSSTNIHIENPPGALGIELVMPSNDVQQKSQMHIQEKTHTS